METKFSLWVYCIRDVVALPLRRIWTLIFDKRGNGTPKLALALLMILIILLVIAFIPQVKEAILEIIRAIRGS